MFMNTSLAQYQLPLFGLNSPAVGTEIGADQRSVFLRPITAAGEPASSNWPATIQSKPADAAMQEYRNWLARVTDYEEATGQPGSSPETAPAEGSGGETAISPPAGNGTGQAEAGAGEPAIEPGDNGAPGGSQTGQTEAGAGGSEPGNGAAPGGGGGSQTGGTGNGGSGSGGLLGWLFGGW